MNESINQSMVISLQTGELSIISPSFNTYYKNVNVEISTYLTHMF
jgi:hypothetical protein